MSPPPKVVGELEALLQCLEGASREVRLKEALQELNEKKSIALDSLEALRVSFIAFHFILFAPLLILCFDLHRRKIIHAVHVCVYVVAVEAAREGGARNACCIHCSEAIGSACFARGDFVAPPIEAIHSFACFLHFLLSGPYFLLVGYILLCSSIELFKVL